MHNGERREFSPFTCQRGRQKPLGAVAGRARAAVGVYVVKLAVKCRGAAGAYAGQTHLSYAVNWFARAV
jgi:hypothetical protein